jgi:hypothetical protein
MREIVDFDRDRAVGRVPAAGWGEGKEGGEGSLMSVGRCCYRSDTLFSVGGLP